MKKIFYNLLGLALACSLQSGAQTITTIGGTGIAGNTGNGGAATSARIYGPSGIALDAAGNIYIADQLNHIVRKINSSGIISTVAGNDTAGYSGDSSMATAARLKNPSAVAVDAAGNIYIADMGNNRIRKVHTSGMITTIAGTGAMGYNGDNIPADSASLNHPRGVAVDAAGNVYIADENNHRVRKVKTDGTIVTIAGTGSTVYNGDAWPSATLAALYRPAGVAVDKIGNVYIADQYNDRIRVVDTGNKITTVAGRLNGYCCDFKLATEASLNHPTGVALDSAGNIYIADADNNRVRMVIKASKLIRTVAGNGSAIYVEDSVKGTATAVGRPQGVAVDGAGSIYIAEWFNNRIRKVTTPVGINDYNAAIPNIKVYPNPSKNGVVTVNISSLVDADIELAIVNMLGEKVYGANVTSNGSFEVALNQPAGIYFVIATSAQGKWSEKIQLLPQ
jgi:sugar lactone lactonase YvrE